MIYSFVDISLHLSFIYIRSMQVSIFREMVKKGSLVKNTALYSEQCAVSLIQADSFTS